MGSPGIQPLLVMSVLLTTDIRENCVLSTGLCQHQTVVEPNPITATQPFCVTCEANRVPAVPPNVTFVNNLLISRRVSANTADSIVANYATKNLPELNLTNSFIPPGRLWTITLTGSNAKDDYVLPNRHTMKIVVVILDTRSEDAGIYRCHVDYYLPGYPTSLPADIYVKVKATGLQQTVVVPNPITANQPFTVTCEANRVPTVPINCDFVYWIHIYRSVSAITNYTKLAEYATNRRSPIQSVELSFIPPGRNWTITFSGINIISVNSIGPNRHTMKIVLVISDTRLEDAGMYNCHVGYDTRDYAATLPADIYVNVTVSDITAAPAKAGPSVVLIIAGIVIGCVVLIAIIICCILRHKRSKLKQSRSSEKVRQNSTVKQEPTLGQDENGSIWLRRFL